MGRSRTWIGALVAGVSTSLVAAAGAGAKTIHVEPGEDTLQEAIDAAEPGDKLLLHSGLYTLSKTVVIDKSLIIRGRSERAADVHIAAVAAEDFDFDFGNPLFADPIKDVGHLLFVTGGAQRVILGHFTIKGAPPNPLLEVDEGPCTEPPPAGLGLNLTECFGDAIHSDGAADLEVKFVQASLNAGNGVFVAGAKKALIRYVRATNNGAFGVDVDTADRLSIRHSVFIANQVSGVEASGHEPGLHRDEYFAEVDMHDVVAKANGEIGIEIERYRKARLRDLTCADNREDGFDADRVSEVDLEDSEFVNNLDDGIEMFPVDVEPGEQPFDFPGSTIYDFDDLEFSGNVGEDIRLAPTEN